MLGDGGRFGWTARGGQGAVTGNGLSCSRMALWPARTALSEQTGLWCGRTAASTTWPLGSPATQSPAPVTEEGLSPALGGSPSLPPSHLYTSCLWVVLPTVLKATHTFPCLLFGSPARSPSPPRPACWPGPDTFLLPDPHAPTHTALHECLPTVS